MQQYTLDEMKTDDSFSLVILVDSFQVNQNKKPEHARAIDPSFYILHFSGKYMNKTRTGIFLDCKQKTVS